MSSMHPDVMADTAAGGVPEEALHPESMAHDKNDKQTMTFAPTNDQVVVSAAADFAESDEPTDEEYATLRKIPAPMKWACIAMCIVELAERASYYGCQQIFANFVNNPLPPGGNGAGAVAPGAAGENQSAGALGMGSTAATAVGQTFTFLAYFIPIGAGIMSDTKWGRMRTLVYGVIVGAVAHFLLIIPAAPKILAGGHAFAGFMICLIILAFASGLIKPCLGPLLCDQSPVKRPTITTTKKGERVILDPQTTIARYFLIFYWCINVGSFFGIATSYSERFVGFWLAFLEPGIVYLICPIVIWLVRKKMYVPPPQGSVVLESLYVLKEILKRGGLKKLFKRGGWAEFWELAKPSNIAAQDGAINPKKVFWDDKFVEEIKASYAACAVFYIIPIFLLADGGLGNAENDLSTSLTLSGIPNDVFNNFNPLAIIIATPIITWGVYPFFEKIGYPLKPMTRMCFGFILCASNMIYGAWLQAKVYDTSPCGKFATNCADGPAPYSVALLIPLYAIPAVAELFVMVTSYELAYTRAPARMKGLVYAICLTNSAVSAIIGLACSAAVVDPHLTTTYIVLAVLTFLCAFLFPTVFKHLDEPMMSFAETARQEGKEQPNYKATDEDAEMGAGGQMEDIDAKH